MLKIATTIILLIFTGCVVVDSSSVKPRIVQNDRFKAVHSISVEQVSGDVGYDDRDSFIDGLKRELKMSSSVRVRSYAPYRLTVHIEKTEFNQRKKKGKFLGSIQYRFLQDVVARADFELVDKGGRTLLSDTALYNASLDTGSSTSFRVAQEEARESVFKEIGERVASRLLKYLPAKDK